MTRVYRWTEDEDDIAPDAITVGIRSVTRLLTIAGLQFGHKEAVVYRPDWYTLKGALEGPMAVEAALDRADKLCTRYAFNRLVIWGQHRELWEDQWGRLAPDPGL